MQKKPFTSWENVERWYSSCVGEKGHYYHQSLIIPGSHHLLHIAKDYAGSVLDLGCGQGVFERNLPDQTTYVGIDASEALIREAKKIARHKNAEFFSADVTSKLPITKRDFDIACFILSLQNIEHPLQALQTTHDHLKKGGKLLLVLNHPCFRIPRQSSWGIDEQNKLQFRKINRYLTPMNIPIQIHPNDPTHTTISFHYPLSDLAKFLKSAHFTILDIEEWASDKMSDGSKAKMENRARNEIPLFLAVLARAE